MQVKLQRTKLMSPWRSHLFIVVVVIARNSHLISIRVHRRKDVDAGGVDKSLDALVPLQILCAQVLSQVDEQLAAQDFISMHVANVLHLWLNCTRSY